MIVLTLPFPPSVNTYWRNITIRGASRTLISKKGREYRDQVIGIVADKARAAIAERLHVAITLHPPDKRRRDVDNYLKAPLDALTHAGVWADDSQIDRLSVTRGDIEPGGRAVVVIGKPEDMR